MNEVVCCTNLSHYSLIYNYIFIFLEGLRYKYNKYNYTELSDIYYSIYLNDDRFIILDDDEFDRYFTSIADFRNKNINKVLYDSFDGN